MLTLYVKSIDQQQEVRNFHCRLDELETALDTLRLITAAGSLLLDVYIIEDGHRTNLSPQAFDGQAILKPIRALQNQWEALLRQSAFQTPPVKSPTLLEMTIQYVNQLETSLVEFDSSIIKLESMMLKAEEQLKEGTLKNQLLLHYHEIITQQYKSMGQLQTKRDKYLKKLTQLRPAYLE